MDLNDYQQAARRTAIYAKDHRVIYPALGLASEAGEVAGKIKKVLRDQGGDFASAPLEAIKDELGDVLWYVAVLAGDLGLPLDFTYLFFATIVTIENHADMQAKFESIFEPGGECPNPLPGRKATRFQ